MGLETRPTGKQQRQSVFRRTALVSRPTAAFAALLVSVMLEAGCGGLRIERSIIGRADDWPTSGRTNSRLSWQPQALRPPLKEQWKLDLAAGFGSGSPLVVDSMVLMGNLRGELSAVQLRTGKKIGSVRLSDAVQGAPAVEGNFVILPLTGSGESVLAYNLNDGRTVWKQALGDVEMSPLVANGRVYFGTTSGRVYCLDRVSGEPLWKYEIPDNDTFKGFRATPAASDSLVFFGDDQGLLYAFSPATGAIRWRTAAGGGIAGGITLVGDLAVTTTTAGMLLGCDARSGAVRWRYKAGSPFYAAPAACGDTVYAGSLDGIMHAVRCTDGTEIWHTALEGPVDAAAVVAGDYLYAGTLKKQIVALQRHDGAAAWTREVDGRIKTPLTVAYGRLLVATDEHTVFCFGEEGR